MTMRQLRTLLVLPLALSAAACGLNAKHSLNRTSPVSQLIIVDAPPGAEVRVDDQIARVGSNGRLEMPLSDGWHQVTISDGGAKIHGENIFIQDGSRKIIDLQP